MSVARPLFHVCDEFLTAAELERLDDLTANVATFGVAVRHDHTGQSCELPLEVDPLLGDIARRIEATIGTANHFGPTFRYRCYSVGESHPPHLDAYRIDNLHLVVSALLYLDDTDAGGETSFPRAEVLIAPRRGRLAYWFNYLPDGSPDPASWHEGLPVLAGQKRTLAYFIYQPLPTARRFVCIDDGVPEETSGSLRAACAARGLEYFAIDPRAFAFDPQTRLNPGDLLYRPAVSYAAMLVEQFLFVPGVATFHRGANGVYFGATGSHELYRLAGLPLPLGLPCVSADRAMLRATVERLGGFPIIAKFGGGEGGVGVLQLDTLPGMFSFVDFALAQGRVPHLMAFVPSATHWRVVVVGDCAVAAYRNAQQADDFRSCVTDDPADVTAEPDAAMADVAVRAVAALELEFGGVDLLRDADGNLYVLEVNFPCYFAHAQRVAGIDVAGAMVDFLLAKSRAVVDCNRRSETDTHTPSPPALRGRGLG